MKTSRTCWLMMLLNGKLDAAVLALPYDCEGLLSFPFWDEDFYFGYPR